MEGGGAQGTLGAQGMWLQLLTGLPSLSPSLGPCTPQLRSCPALRACRPGDVTLAGSPSEAQRSAHMCRSDSHLLETLVGLQSAVTTRCHW